MAASFRNVRQPVVTMCTLTITPRISVYSCEDKGLSWYTQRRFPLTMIFSNCFHLQRSAGTLFVRRLRQTVVLYLHVGNAERKQFAFRLGASKLTHGMG